LEFSRTRTHYLVFKEQVLVLTIVTIPAPLSRGLFFRLAYCPPPSGNCFCNPTGLPCQPLAAVYFLPCRANPPASRQRGFISNPSCPVKPRFRTFPPRTWEPDLFRPLRPGCAWAASCWTPQLP